MSDLWKFIHSPQPVGEGKRKGLRCWRWSSNDIAVPGSRVAIQLRRLPCTRRHILVSLLAHGLVLLPDMPNSKHFVLGKKLKVPVCLRHPRQLPDLPPAQIPRTDFGIGKALCRPVHCSFQLPTRTSLFCWVHGATHWHPPLGRRVRWSFRHGPLRRECRWPDIVDELLMRNRTNLKGYSFFSSPSHLWFEWMNLAVGVQCVVGWTIRQVPEAHCVISSSAACGNQMGRSHSHLRHIFNGFYRRCMVIESV
jgi:hypothetical protein